MTSSNQHLQQALQHCSPDMQAEIAYRLALQESKQRSWLNLAYQLETIVTTAAVIATLAILLVPGVNQSTTDWYFGIPWLNAAEKQPDQEKQSDQAAEEQKLETQQEATGRIFPLPGKTHATAELSSGYGSRESPGGIGSTFHRGYDYPAPTGNPVLAIESGTVKVWTDGSCGNGIELKAKDRSFIYCHLDTVTVANGQSVPVGTVVGTVGSTGGSTGPHIHIGIIEGGDYIDPGEYLKVLPSNLESPPEAPAATAATSSVSPDEAQQYFLELNGFEFSDSKASSFRGVTRIEILGNPTEVDRETIKQVMQDLLDLGANGIEIVESGGNVQLHFAETTEFGNIVPDVVKGSIGFFSRKSEAEEGTILIATDRRISQQDRQHLIREEVTQLITGLGKDSDRYNDSIFQQRHDPVIQYSEIDKAVIRMAFEK